MHPLPQLRKAVLVAFSIMDAPLTTSRLSAAAFRTILRTSTHQCATSSLTAALPATAFLRRSSRQLRSRARSPLLPTQRFPQHHLLHARSGSINPPFIEIAILLIG